MVWGAIVAVVIRYRGRFKFSIPRRMHACREIGRPLAISLSIYLHRAIVSQCLKPNQSIPVYTISFNQYPPEPPQRHFRELIGQHGYTIRSKVCIYINHDKIRCSSSER